MQLLPVLNIAAYYILECIPKHETNVLDVLQGAYTSQTAKTNVIYAMIEIMRHNAQNVCISLYISTLFAVPESPCLSAPPPI